MSERASFAVGESARLILLRCPRRHLLLSPARPRRRPRPLWLRREPTLAALSLVWCAGLVRRPSLRGASPTAALARRQRLSLPGRNPPRRSPPRRRRLGLSLPLLRWRRAWPSRPRRRPPRSSSRPRVQTWSPNLRITPRRARPSRWPRIPWVLGPQTSRRRAAMRRPSPLVVLRARSSRLRSMMLWSIRRPRWMWTPLHLPLVMRPRTRAAPLDRPPTLVSLDLV